MLSIEFLPPAPIRPLGTFPHDEMVKGVIRNILTLISPINGRRRVEQRVAAPCSVFPFLPFMGKGAQRADRGGECENYRELYKKINLFKTRRIRPYNLKLYKNLFDKTGLFPLYPVRYHGEIILVVKKTKPLPYTAKSIIYSMCIL